MKTKSAFTLLLLISSLSVKLFAGDTYAEYKMTGIGNKNIINKLFIKNGDMRSEVTMDAGGKEMTTFTLNLKNNPGISLVFNSQTKMYTEVKKGADSSQISDLSISILGAEKVGDYNCKHVRMTSNSKSWDMWVTKDLPSFNFPIEKDNEAANHKIYEVLKSKGADGVMVKLAFLKPGTNTANITMELIKFENKNLDDSLFKIPEGYTKSTANYDLEKMKSMSPEEKKEMIKKIMEENAPHK